MVSGQLLKILVYEWVTGGGLAGSPLPASWAAEGSAMRRSIAADFAKIAGKSIDVSVTLDARLPDEPGPWRIVRIGLGENAARVSELARSADFTILIAPETSRILASLTRELLHAGARTLGSTAEAVERTGDKARLAEWLRSLGIDTPPCRVIDPSIGLPADTVYPAVLKPVDGADRSTPFTCRTARACRKQLVSWVPRFCNRSWLACR